MAARSESSEDNSGHHDGIGSSRVSQMTPNLALNLVLNDAGYPTLYRPNESRALVRRPSVDFAKLTKKESRAIVDYYFRRSALPDTSKEEIPDKILDAEVRKVLTTGNCGNLAK